MSEQVLVVEDEDDLRDSVAEVLHLQGYAVSTAANGREALNQLTDGLSPDLILLDLMMPVMDGWAFRRRQLEDDDLADIPVIVFTSAKSVEVTEDFDVDVVLEKPVEIERLIEVIDDTV